MKNAYCKLSEDEIRQLNIPNNLKGLLWAPFEWNLKNGYIMVPEDAFQDFVDITTEYLQSLSTQNNSKSNETKNK